MGRNQLWLGPPRGHDPGRATPPPRPSTGHGATQSRPHADAWVLGCVSPTVYEMSIFEEDLDLQRRALSGLEIPLDPAAELHTRADRVSVEFRRVLAAAVSD